MTGPTGGARTGERGPTRWLSDNRLLFVVVGAICLLGLLLRLAGIGERTLFWDEAYHVRLVLLPSIGEMLGAVLANPPSDPLYVLILRAWTQLAGTADAAVRLPSTIFGAATAAATAWLGWELTRSRMVAVGSALLVAIAPYAVEFGQEASLYAFATLTTTLAVAAAWRWRQSGLTSHAALAVALAIVAAYSHYLVPAILGFAALIALTPLAGPRRASTRAMLLAGAIVLLAWTPWLVPMAISWLTAEQPRTALLNAAQPNELLGALSQYASGSGALLAGVRPVQIMGILAAAVLVAAGWLVGADPNRRGLRVVVVTATVFFLGPWLASALTDRWLFVPHLSLFVLPAVAVVVASGALLAPSNVDRIRRSRVTKMLIAGAAAGLIAAQVLGLYIDAVDPPHGNDGVGQLADVLRAEAAPVDPVFVTPLELQPVLQQYWPGLVYGLPTDFDLHRIYQPYDPPYWYERDATRFTELTTNRPRAWVVYRPERDEGGRLLAWLGQRGQVTQRGSFPFADLYLISLR